jgi:hypothetical protein
MIREGCVIEIFGIFQKAISVRNEKKIHWKQNKLSTFV